MDVNKGYNPDMMKRYFHDVWKGETPIAKLFRTRENCYLYDTGTSRVFKCKAHVFHLLDCFFSMDIDRAAEAFLKTYSEEEFIDAGAQIKDAIEKEGVLSFFGATRFGMSDHYGDLNELIDSSMGQMTLEVTEKCNLRCDYCVYNPYVEQARNHGARDMSLEVAYKAIDYLKAHSFKTEQRYITFYGGEPFLRFDFIRSCVEYANSVFEGKPLKFSATTNGIMITPEIAQYVLENNFSIVISIDGPKDIHDNYRKDSLGKGSFEQTVKGLKTVVDVFKEKAAERVLLSMVYTPPFSGKKIDRIAELWDELPWLPKNIQVLITYPSEGTIPPGRISKADLEEDKPLDRWGLEKFEKKIMGIDTGHAISNGIEEKKLARFMQRLIFYKPVDKFYLNGCCVPGVRKLFTAVDGTFRVCDKISYKAPGIGDVFSGLNRETIKKVYIDDYERLSLPACSKCWAIRLCNLCYVQAFKDENFDANRKLKACHVERNLKKSILEFHSGLMEVNPKGLDYLYDLKLE
jgi:uncharacterized protein